MRRLTLFVAAIAIVLTACGSAGDDTAGSSSGEQAYLPAANITELTKWTAVGGSFVEVMVYHDDDLNVTCWIFDGYRSGGQSCIPDHLLEPSDAP